MNKSTEIQQYNIGHICSSLICQKGRGNDTAIVSLSADGRKIEYLYSDIDAYSNKIANALRMMEFNEGEVIFTLMGRSFFQAVSFLGALKLKLITGTLFANFGEDAIYERLSDSKAKGVITQKKQLGKLKNIKSKLPELRYIFVTDIEEHQDDHVLSLKKLINNASDMFTADYTSALTPSILHYTSGSTGKPKGVLHAHQSVILQKQTSTDILSLTESDVYWCTADPGWVTGISYGVIGPMSLGIKQIYYEGGYNPEEWLNILINEKVTVWYTAPTALRMLMQEDDGLFNNKAFPDLKYIFSIGEPLNPEVLLWATAKFGRNVYDTYFQTETGSIMVSNSPAIKIKPGSMGKPINSIKVEILDDNADTVPQGHVGNIAIKAPWESMFLTYLNNEDVYRNKYKKGFYFTGDKARMDKDGYLWFSGRNDDIINTAGHLVSPFEVESALLEMEGINDVAVIAANDDILFEKIVAFIKIADGFKKSNDYELKIRLYISKRVSPIAVPKEIIVTDKIPKNKSGKIMRRYLRAIYEGKDPGDISTIDE